MHFLKEIKKPLIFLTILLVASVWLGYYSGTLHPVEGKELLQKLSEDLGVLKNVNSVALFLFIFLNNAVKSFVMAMLGFLFGIVPIIFIVVNGLLIGVIASVVIAKQGVEVLLVGTIPHGVFEIPAFLIAGAYGMQLGRKYYYKLRYNEPIKPAFLRTMKQITKIVIPVLIIASFIETFVTMTLLRAL